jgi:hypothetical protein
MFRQYLAILFIILFQTVAVFGQKTVTRIEYENVIDELNCTMAKFYIEQNQGVYELQAYNDSIAQFGCSFEHLMIFIKERQPQMATNGYLAAHINSLKSEFDLQITNGALFNKTVDVFKEDILIDYDSREDYQLVKTNLIADLKNKLRVDEVADNKGQLQEMETSIWTNFQDLQGWKIVLIIFIILFLLVLIGFARWGLKYTQTGKGDKSTFLIRNPQQNIPSNTTSNVDTTSTINSKFEEAKKRPAPKPKTVVEKSIAEKVEVILAEEQMEKKEEVLDNEPEVFYMPYPKVDGSFYESARHEIFQYGKSTFRFEIKVVEYNLATFEIISNEDVITDIFVNPEIINPVCDIEGKQKDIKSTLKSGVSKIITVIPGTVQLRNSHWRLKQKAVIRFEYE